MEPVTLIVTALAAGAAVAAKDVAKDAVTDAYQGLKTLIVDRYEKAKTGVDLIEQNPTSEARQLAAKEVLEESGATKDQEVVEAAKAVMEKAEPEKAAKGAFTLTVGRDSYGAIQGNQGDVKQEFNFGKD